MKIFKAITRLVEASVDSSIKVVESVGETAVNVAGTTTKVSEVIGKYAEAQVQVADMQIGYTVQEAKVEAEISLAELKDRLEAVQASAKDSGKTAVSPSVSNDISDMLGM